MAAEKERALEKSFPLLRTPEGDSGSSEDAPEETVETTAETAETPPPPVEGADESLLGRLMSSDDGSTGE